MSDSILEQILKELSVIRSTMVTKEELKQEVSKLATKEELEELKQEVSKLATKEEMNKGFADIKQLMTEFHSENITADEKLLDIIRTTNDQVQLQFKKTQEQLNTHEHSIGILHRNQLKLETEIEKMKNR